MADDGGSQRLFVLRGLLPDDADHVGHVDRLVRHQGHRHGVRPPADAPGDAAAQILAPRPFTQAATIGRSARSPVRQHAAPASRGTPSMLTVRPILPKIEGGRVQGLLQLIEDGIHLVVAAFLVVLAGLLAVGVVHDVIRSIQGPYREDVVVLSALDNGLVLFIVAELLHTVRLTIRNQTLDAEPFLVVGLIAGIRKVLIVTAEAEKSFRWNVEGIELLILAGLILVMATAAYVWRRSTRPGDYFPLQEAGRSPSPAPSSTPVRGS